MKPSQILPLHTAGSWQEQLQHAMRSREALAHSLGLDTEALPFAEGAAEQFPLLVPHAFAQRMEHGNAQDPLLRQVLAIPQELENVNGYTRDPVGELGTYRDQTGMIRKYQGRALFVVTGQCAINCRYCFRRHYPYDEETRSSSDRLTDLEQLLREPDLTEVLLSGGDPLLLPDKQLARIAAVVAQREDVTLRIHSRLPIAIPDRVTDGLLAALEGRVVVVVHANHPAEIDAATAKALRRLRAAGFTVLNQSVLLARVNDDPTTLATLSEALFAAGTLPYYLHMLDPVAGAAHFAVAEERARRIVGEVAERLPGYLVPRLMRETPGAGSKRELSPLYP